MTDEQQPDPLRKLILQKMGELPPDEKPQAPSLRDYADAQTRKLNAAIDRAFTARDDENG